MSCVMVIGMELSIPTCFIQFLSFEVLVDLILAHKKSFMVFLIIKTNAKVMTFKEMLANWFQWHSAVFDCIYIYN